jgi:hypothetical protein
MIFKYLRVPLGLPSTTALAQQDHSASFTRHSFLHIPPGTFTAAQVHHRTTVCSVSIMHLSLIQVPPGSLLRPLKYAWTPSPTSLVYSILLDQDDNSIKPTSGYLSGHLSMPGLSPTSAYSPRGQHRVSHVPFPNPSTSGYLLRHLSIQGPYSRECTYSPTGQQCDI